MKSFHNIEKSAFRRFEYVGYAAGRVFRIRKSGFGYWEAWQNEPGVGLPYFRAKGLEAVSAKLEELAR